MPNIKHTFYVMAAASLGLVLLFHNFIPHSTGDKEMIDYYNSSGFFTDDSEDEPEQRRSYFEIRRDQPKEPDSITIPPEYTGEKIDHSTEKNAEPTEKKFDISSAPKKGSSSKFTQDDLTELNAKIQEDPLLQRFAENFKRLKSSYEGLGKKFQKLNREHRQTLQKSKSGAQKSGGVQQSVRNSLQTTALQTKLDTLTKRQKQVQMVLRYSNPFNLLGAYPNITLEYFNSYPDGKPFYERFNYGLHNDPDYCELADLYNLAHPENIFKRKAFFTDYAKNGLPRKQVMRKIGYDLSPKVSKYMSKKDFKSRSMHLDPRITMFFTKRVDLHIYHEIGKHFLCATQMYNHIPGHGVLKRKDMIVDSVDAYALRYKDKGTCFNKNKFFPFSYRLYIKEECKAFFNIIKSKKYIESLKQEPIQYLIKIGFGSHRAQGVFLLDQAQTSQIRGLYHNGEKCGSVTRSLIAQTYVTNPLLLDRNNKFDFRIYMLIASTNPLIVFYHDGFLRVSLNEYNKFSNEKSTHLTNTHLSKDAFANVNNKTLEEELRNYQMWTLDRLQAYLLESGKITDKNWLNNHLRPKFKEAFVHIVRMTQGPFWKQSNVFELFGLDFMLDSDLNLWFIECNSSPQLIGTNEQKTAFLVKMIKDTFDIEYAYYKSRMKRILRLIKKMDHESAEKGEIDYDVWKKEYIEATKNRLEPEFHISKENSFQMIMDMNLKGTKAYFGILPEECVDD